MGVVVIKGLIPTNVRQCPLLDRKMVSLTPRHHECRETKIIVKEAKSCFSPLPKNQGTPKISLTMEKYTHCLSIICKNHIFQDPIGFL